MKRNSERENERRLVSLRSEVLETVSGGDFDDYFPGFDWVSASCQNGVRNAIDFGGNLDSGLDAWNGSDCKWYGYYPW